jgi:hypothetical protein
MTTIIDFFLNNGLGHFINNLYGLYLPLIISVIIIVFADKKELFKKENIIMFVISIIGCFLLSTGVSITHTQMIDDVSLVSEINQVHIVNVFSILYLLYFAKKENREKRYNFGAIWIFSFLSLWLTDGYLATVSYGASGLFDSGVGGAGVFDGLLLDPIIGCFFAYILQKVKDKKPEKNN